MSLKGLILIVDDTPANLHLLSNVLKKEGYEYLEASDGKTALKLAKSHHPDLILLDIMMPGMDGLEVTKALKNDAELEDIPVIFLSSLNDIKNKIDAFKVGGVDYITKPFQKAETLARIKTHLHIRSLQQQLGERIRILKEREDELSKLNRKKDDLVRMVSHDIKNPLTGIVGLARFLKHKQELSRDDQEEMFTVIEESGNNLLRMVQEMLDLEDREMEGKPLDCVKTMLDPLIKRVIAINRAKAVTKEIEFGYSVEPRELEACIDAAKIEILVNNLVANALKFTPSGGKVFIEVTINSSNTFLIKVKDTGIGLPEDLKDNVFSGQSHISRKGTGGETGTGLGLNIVKLYVEKHQGKVWTESEPAEGTTFFIELPLKSNIKNN
ncbi:hybrid sensor histidine kinase/response regulator [Gracilimonas mengyeensis]|uniref:histidine kinase n=1 Tax=Gracilimonas mengyeensis TaxID=1302730 RepID=A0A521AIC0_9BACT|nr:hybrid sensor histidine kinase/response regulator [Gracilimonas mengyeensis]SMO34533.1 Signal transduction histidine kinase [Gracilimonas mengyeensis]